VVAVVEQQVQEQQELLTLLVAQGLTLFHLGLRSQALALVVTTLVAVAVADKVAMVLVLVAQVAVALEVLQAVAQEFLVRLTQVAVGVALARVATMAVTVVQVLLSFVTQYKEKANENSKR
jgi:hypothetical protein